MAKYTKHTGTHTSTHANTLDTCVYITVSLCGPLPCNMSLIGLVELWCMSTHTRMHSFATPILFSHGTQLHFQGQGWGEEKDRLAPGGRKAPCCSVQGRGLSCLLRDAGLLLRLLYRCIYLDTFNLLSTFFISETIT